MRHNTADDNDNDASCQMLAPCRVKNSLKNAVSFQMESESGPCGLDVHGPADDADFSRRIPIRQTPHGDGLDLALVGRRPFEILPLGELSMFINGHMAATGSDHVVL